MMHRVYISASTQKENIGVGNYGNEQDRMMQLSDRILYWLRTQKYTVFRNQPNWSLEQTVNDCNKLACELFVDNHTNSGPNSAQGTEVYYYGQGGTSTQSYAIAKKLYDRIAPLSPGKDRGVKPDTCLYPTGLYVIQKTNPPACLIEHIFHSNIADVNDFVNSIDTYAKESAKAIVEYFSEKWTEPVTQEQTITELVNEMILDGIISDKYYWLNVLNGNITPKPEYLQVAFRRAVNKI